MKRIEESARWADLTIRLVVKANSMSARWADLTIRLVVKANSMSARKHTSAVRVNTLHAAMAFYR